MTRTPSPTPPELYEMSLRELASKLKEVLKQKTEKRSWENLLEGNLCIGEKHDDISPKKFLIENMALFAEQGFKVLFMEHLSIKEDSDLLSKYFSSDVEMPEDLTEKLLRLDKGNRSPFRDSEYSDGWGKHNFTQIVKTAKQNGITVLPLEESEASWKSEKDGARRATILNLNAKKVIDQHGGSKWLALVGSAHLNTYHDVPGICEIIPNVQDLLITDYDESSSPQSLEVYTAPTDVRWATYDVSSVDGSTSEACIKVSMSLIRDFKSDMSYQSILDEHCSRLSLGAAENHKDKKARSKDEAADAVSLLDSTPAATLKMPKKTEVDDKNPQRLKPSEEGGKNEVK